MIKNLVWNDSPTFAVAPFGLIFVMQEIKDGVRVSLIEEESELPIWSRVCQSKTECRGRAQEYFEKEILSFWMPEFMPYRNDFPDWGKAPEWARYFAVDQNGIAFWFNNEPYADTATWRIDAAESQYREAFRTRQDWKTTLVKRP